MSRIKNKEESDEIKENDIKYIYNHIIVFFTYQFNSLELSKDGIVISLIMIFFLISFVPLSLSHHYFIN